ncbi:hypothetical protein COO60DRAFT_712878 [Scenedesmus sp. NREL 46B-D3]|nr:hypothetical protein COO60DRAFT_712878 [Scenedesmus sp. NREL 46B-D3]
MPPAAAAGSGRGSGTAGSGGSAAAQQVVGYELQLVMEYCPLGSLRCAIDACLLDDRLTNRPNYATALSLALGVARAMQHLHSEGVIHGDLKAANVLLKMELAGNPAAAAAAGASSGAARRHSDGGDKQQQQQQQQQSAIVAKVADFGLATRLDDSETHVSGVHRGTLTHMAPELLLQGRASKASDVYAFGILLWELATGRRAFSEVPRVMLGAAVVRDAARPEWPEGSSVAHAAAFAAAAAAAAGLPCAAADDAHPPQHYRRLTEACWAQDPADRPDFGEVCEALELLLTQQQERMAVLSTLLTQQQQQQQQPTSALPPAASQRQATAGSSAGVRGAPAAPAARAAALTAAGPTRPAAAGSSSKPAAGSSAAATPNTPASCAAAVSPFQAASQSAAASGASAQTPSAAAAAPAATSPAAAAGEAAMYTVSGSLFHSVGSVVGSGQPPPLRQPSLGSSSSNSSAQRVSAAAAAAAAMAAVLVRPPASVGAPAGSESGRSPSQQQQQQQQDRSSAGGGSWGSMGHISYVPLGEVQQSAAAAAASDSGGSNTQRTPTWQQQQQRQQQLQRQASLRRRSAVAVAAVLRGQWQDTRCCRCCRCACWYGRSRGTCQFAATPTAAAAAAAAAEKWWQQGSSASGRCAGASAPALASPLTCSRMQLGWIPPMCHTHKPFLRVSHPGFCGVCPAYLIPAPGVQGSGSVLLKWCQRSEPWRCSALRWASRLPGMPGGAVLTWLHGRV